MGTVTVKRKNVKQIGKYLYFRREIDGKDTYIRLPPVDDPEFEKAYSLLANGAAAAQPAPEKPAEGSIAALVAAYRASKDFTRLKPKTRQNYRRYLDLFVSEHGKAPVRGLTTPIVYAIRDGMEETPGKANNYISILSTIIAWSIPRGWRGTAGTNPCDGVPRLKLGEHKPWPAELITRALAIAKPRTRLAIITGLCSGQRIEDCIEMREDMIDGALMQLTQQKTGKTVYIPMHPLWLAEIEAQPKHGDYILTSRFRRKYASTSALQDQIRELMAESEIVELLDELRAARKIGENDNFTFHGLRKNSTNFLAECQLTPHQISSINGMSLEMIEHYTKGVHTKRLAQSAAAAVTEGKIVSISKPKAKVKTANPVNRDLKSGTSR